jgi:hypothetical protein
MSSPRYAFRTSPSNDRIKEIQTQPEPVKDMPYAPAIRLEGRIGNSNVRAEK